MGKCNIYFSNLYSISPGGRICPILFHSRHAAALSRLCLVDGPFVTSIAPIFAELLLHGYVEMTCDGNVTTAVYSCSALEVHTNSIMV